jgi:hypothetical protein
MYGNPGNLGHAPPWGTQDAMEVDSMNVDHQDSISAPTKRIGKLKAEYDHLLSATDDLTLNQQQELLKMLLSDPVLQNLPTDALSSEYVDSLIRVETGQAFPIHIVRFTGDKFSTPALFFPSN